MAPNKAKDKKHWAAASKGTYIKIKYGDFQFFPTLQPLIQEIKTKKSSNTKIAAINSLVIKGKFTESIVLLNLTM